MHCHITNIMRTAALIPPSPKSPFLEEYYPDSALTWPNKCKAMPIAQDKSSFTTLNLREHVRSGLHRLQEKPAPVATLLLLGPRHSSTAAHGIRAFIYARLSYLSVSTTDWTVTKPEPINYRKERKEKNDASSTTTRLRKHPPTPLKHRLPSPLPPPAHVFKPPRQFATTPWHSTNPPSRSKALAKK